MNIQKYVYACTNACLSDRTMVKTAKSAAAAGIISHSSALLFDDKMHDRSVNHILKCLIYPAQQSRLVVNDSQQADIVFFT